MARRQFVALLVGGALPATSRAQSTPLSPIPSATFEFEKLPVRKNETAEFRAVLKGKTLTGEEIEIHHTTVAPGFRPHAGHRHAHSELWLLCEGDAEFELNGATYRMKPGSVAFASSNDEHAIRNVGAAPARYFIVTLGPGAASR